MSQLKGRKPKPFSIDFGFARASSYNGEVLVALEVAVESNSPAELKDYSKDIAICIRTPNSAKERWLPPPAAYLSLMVLKAKAADGYEFRYDGTRNIELVIAGEVVKRWPTNKPAAMDNVSWLRPLALMLNVPEADLVRMFPPIKAKQNGHSAEPMPATEDVHQNTAGA